MTLTTSGGVLLLTYPSRVGLACCMQYRPKNIEHRHQLKSESSNRKSRALLRRLQQILCRIIFTALPFDMANWDDQLKLHVCDIQVVV